MGVGEVDDRSQDHRGAGPGGCAPRAHLLDGDRTGVALEPGQPCAGAERLVRQVAVEDDLTATAHGPPCWLQGGAVEVVPLLAVVRCADLGDGERLLPAGKHAERLGASHLDPVGGPGSQQLLCQVAHRGLELDGVGAVQDRGHRHGPAGGPLRGRGVEPDLDAPALQRGLHVVQRPREVVAPDRGLDDALESLHADGVQVGGDLGVDMVCCGERQVAGGLRHAAGAEGGDPPAAERRPAAGKTVGQLHRVGQQQPAAVGGHAQREGQLGDGELRDGR